MHGVLLLHTRFPNQDILRLRRRKPLPGSREAERLAEWEPLSGANAKTRGLPIQECAQRQLKEAERAAACIRPDWVNWHHSDAEAIDKRNAAIEAILGSTQSARQRCNECHFKRGDFARHTRANAGSAAVPMVKNRRLQLVTPLERLFPDLFARILLEEARIMRYEDLPA
ncbi:hypothetical protein B0H19DRAFT_1270148 [Mycena capillaripes]|nr:hypothetical protein B0H19DRAFT_1270148 [Mycena capillaripes]